MTAMILKKITSVVKMVVMMIMSIFTNELYLISKIKTTAVLKSSNPKTPWEVKILLTLSKEGTKKPPSSVRADYCGDLMQVLPCFHCGVDLTFHR